jgi:UDP-glucose 4-epimerase
MKKEIIVTGGAGFIGACLAERLIKEDYKVIVLDNFSTGYRENIPDGAEFIYFDVSQPGYYNKLKNIKPAAVFHIAGQSSGEVSFDNPLYDFDVNARSTLLMLDYCKTNEVKRFFYASSMSVYGNKMKQVNETEPPEPISFYGASKLASERYIDIYSKAGIASTAFRLFNVYGPMQNLNNMRQGMASIYMAYVLNNAAVHVKGALDRYRDFIYIDEVIDCFIECFNNRNAENKIYNVGSGKKTTIIELLESIFSAAEKKDYPYRSEGSTPGDTFGIYADITKITSETNWRPGVNIDDGLKKMFDFYNKARR